MLLIEVGVSNSRREQEIGKTVKSSLDIWLPDGTVKSLSIAGAAKLQGFPDWYEFPQEAATAGSIIGYSVPPSFGRVMSAALAAGTKTE
ncbi:DNA cytosine methyltransferase [Nostoc sp. MG11]|uniref:DNA cytosine methyltransferase n=1 Tax=Nostoc sp. MG11 TaxID=2721166 RepID=UPI001D007C86|nr:DNA cytosine methyltransferase [Nostoc sp. MG11]